MEAPGRRSLWALWGQSLGWLIQAEEADAWHLQELEGA